MPAKKDEHRDNPHGEDFRTMSDDGKRYKILSTAVGHHREGSVVSARELGEGAQLPRLVKLGAIRQLSSDEVEEHENPGQPPNDNEGLKNPVVQPTGTGPLPPTPLGTTPPSGETQTPPPTTPKPADVKK